MDETILLRVVMLEKAGRKILWLTKLYIYPSLCHTPVQFVQTKKQSMISLPMLEQFRAAD